MPTLDWLGKKTVVEHHKQVPFHLLRCNNDLSIGDPGSGNLLVQADNLLALKALLPYYAGQVKCIYIDPPYNTGNENWIYNDNVNSPEMREWLGKTVGKEAEDLSRHDKWLCMMYPRLSLLNDFLREDGAIFISIDDNEVHSLRMLMDEIFGKNNFISTIVWQKIYTLKNSAKHLSEMHDYVVIYAKRKESWMRNLIPRTAKNDEDYKNPDNDVNGPWISNALQSRNFYSKGTYSIKCPGSRFIEGPPKGTYWRMSEEKFWQMDSEGRVWWGENRNNSPRIKKYLKEAKTGVVPSTWWTHDFAGSNSTAKVQVRQLLDDKEVFITPKPVELVRRILDLSTDKDSLILDSFAGSGTTGHAVLEQNKFDDGNRKFILVEMDSDICRNITAQRLKRVSQGHKEIEPLGGGFRYCQLGEPLFDSEGRIGKEVSFSDLAHHVFFVATGEPLPKATKQKSPLLGISKGVAVYLLYNGILKDKSVDGGNVLTREVLSALPKYDSQKIVYGNGCRIGAERLKRERIIFRQIPYQLRVD